MRNKLVGFLVSCLAITAVESSAYAAPEHGQDFVPVHIAQNSVAGYVLASTKVTIGHDGTTIHGRICRSALSAYPISRLAIDWSKMGQSSVPGAKAYVYGMSSWRWLGCGYYTATLSGAISANDRVQIGLAAPSH